MQNYNKIYIHSILCHPARFDGLVSLFKLQFICLYHFDKVNDLIYFAECKRTYTHFYGVHTPYTLHTHINVLILICLRIARKWFRVECIIKYTISLLVLALQTWCGDSFFAPIFTPVINSNFNK